MVATNEELKFNNKCPKCNKGFLYNAQYDHSSDVWIEECDNSKCDFRQDHKDRRKTKR